MHSRSLGPLLCAVNAREVPPGNYILFILCIFCILDEKLLCSLFACGRFWDKEHRDLNVQLAKPLPFPKLKQSPSRLEIDYYKQRRLYGFYTWSTFLQCFFLGLGWYQSTRYSFADCYYQQEPTSGSILTSCDFAGIRIKIWNRAKVRRFQTHSLAGGGSQNLG